MIGGVHYTLVLVRGPHAVSTATPPPVQGIESRNEAPGPSFGSAESRPRCFSMMERLIDRLMPIPSVFVVSNAFKKLVHGLGVDAYAGIPTRTSTRSSSLRSVLISNCRGRSSTSTIASATRFGVVPSTVTEGLRTQRVLSRWRLRRYEGVVDTFV